MAFQRIRIKNTNVSGKIPGADKLDTAELCINLKDQKLFSKDADGNVFELGGGKVESGPTPPPNGNEIGDLWWDGDFLLVWNGSEWVTVGASDLDYEPDPAKGTITNTNGDDVDLPLVDDTNAGLMSPDEHKKLDDMPVIISGDTFPGTPELGDIWFDTSDCPPTLNIWDDCDDPGNPVWKPIGGGELPGCQQTAVQIIGDSEIGSTLTAVGGYGNDEGSNLPATYEWTGAKTGTGSTIVADVEGDYTVTATITCVDGSTLSTSATKTVSDSYVDMVNNTPPVIAVVGEGPDGAYEGNSLYVVTPATVINGENPAIVENQWYKNGADPVVSQLYEIDATDVVGTVITCRQLFRDARTNEILSDASNGITIVARPAGAITFAPVITDDGTPNANTPGHVLTASAENIQGGTAPVEYSYKWLVEGLTMGDQKTLNIIQTFVGKIVSCEVTVAEPDGTNPETRTAVYSKPIEIAGTINTPTVLAPADGAGSGDVSYLKSDTITDVEDMGGGQTKLTVAGSTDLADMTGATFMSDGAGSGPYTQTPYKLTTTEIESVSGSAPAITLTFPGDVSTNPDLRYFATGDEVQSGVSVVSTGYPNSNTMVVDGGSWGAGANQDAVWSQMASAQAQGSKGHTRAFDGDPDTSNIVAYTDGDTSNITFTLTPVPINAPVEIKAYDNENSTGIICNGVTINNKDTDPVVTQCGTTSSNTLTIIQTVTNVSSRDETAIYYVKVGGKMLVDSGVVGDFGDPNVEYQTKGGQGTIVSVNTDDNTLLISNTGDRDNRWIAENKAGTDFAVAGPSIADEPLLTADVRLQSSLFATTPADADTLKNIVWGLTPQGQAETTQDAGTTNPYTPTGLALNTTYTVRVKHQGNAIEDSAWSASTTFTTGATRNLYTYYEEKIATLVTRIEELEDGA